MLVGLIRYPDTRERAEEHLSELEFLADTAGADTVTRLLQGLSKPDGATYVGKGKLEEMKELVEEEQIDLVVVDDDLSPIQMRNLEKSLERKVVDRTGLILDIFASRARSSEARTQVELAQLQYMLPRLTRQWTHLSKQYGGIGTKGPGETQIETDRRMIRTRIAHLREKLERIETQRETQRKGRDELFRIALVGYTNAGKSTLMNELAGAEVHAENRLFATIDTTVRSMELGNGRRVLLSDTVGFIRKLPQHLVASFRSTLAEVREADLLLHVVDVASPVALEQIAVVEETLRQIGADTVPTLMVLNKVDMIEGYDETLRDMLARYPDAIAVSAMRGLHITALRERLLQAVDRSMIERNVQVPIARYSMVQKVHELAEVLETTFDDHSAYMRLVFSPKVRGQVDELLSRAGARTLGSEGRLVER